MTSTTNPSEITGLRQIALKVSDVARATEFYRDTLGLPFLFAAGPNLAFLNVGDVRLMLSTPEAGLEPGKGSMMYFKVADIQKAHATMTGRGVSFVDAPHMIAKMPDHELWLAEFYDPDRNPLALMCEVR